MNSYRSALNYAQSVEEAKGSQNLKPCGPGLSSGAGGLANRPRSHLAQPASSQAEDRPYHIGGWEKVFRSAAKMSV